MVGPYHRGGAGEGGGCCCRADLGGRAGLLQSLGKRRADRGGVNVRRGATDPLGAADLGRLGSELARVRRPLMVQQLSALDQRT